MAADTEARAVAAELEEVVAKVARRSAAKTVLQGTQEASAAADAVVKARVKIDSPVAGTAKAAAVGPVAAETTVAPTATAAATARTSSPHRLLVFASRLPFR